MYVCICLGVTDRQVREAFEQGARSMRALRQQLGVASECGKCAACAHDILKECKEGKSLGEAEGCVA